MNELQAIPEKPNLNRRYRMQWEPAQQSYVLLYPEGMVKLNQSAAEIIKRCDGSRSISQIISEIESAFETSGLQEQIEKLLQMAFDNNWIQ